MSRVHDLIDAIIEKEGHRYTNHPEDSGGPTKYGITQATLSRWRRRLVSAEDVKNLSFREAHDILLARYWYQPGFQKIAPISDAIAEELCDTGVNMGPATAVEFLQRLLTTFNNRGSHYPDLLVDGRLGPKTANALTAYLDRRGQNGHRVLLFCLDSLQAERYVALAERREKDEKFVFGQVLQRAAERWKFTIHP